MTRTRPLRTRWLVASALGATVVLSAAAVLAAIVTEQDRGDDATPLSPAPIVAVSATPPVTAPPAPPAIDASALPEARYDAVVAGLVAVDGRTLESARVYSSPADIALYDAPGGSPVARLAATDFLGEPTPVVVVDSDGEWGLVLTPARRILPSQAGAGAAPSAQSAGWAWLGDLTLVSSPTERVVVSTSAQTVSVVTADGTVEHSFPAGVGSAETPSPTDVTGYLEQRYVDPDQGTGPLPIHLTSLHSTVADEPYGGSDGGLIGIHWSDDRTGAVSHGCIRIGDDAVAALSALPLGTLVTFTG